MYIYLSLNVGAFWMWMSYRLSQDKICIYELTQCIDMKKCDQRRVSGDHQLFVNNAKVARLSHRLQIHTHTHTHAFGRSMHTDTQCYQWGCRHLVMLLTGVYFFSRPAAPISALVWLWHRHCHHWSSSSHSDGIAIPQCLRFHFHLGFFIRFAVDFCCWFVAINLAACSHNDLFSIVHVMRLWFLVCDESDCLLIWLLLL